MGARQNRCACSQKPMSIQSIKKGNVFSSSLNPRVAYLVKRVFPRAEKADMQRILDGAPSSFDSVSRFTFDEISNMEAI